MMTTVAGNRLPNPTACCTKAPVSPSVAVVLIDKPSGSAVETSDLTGLELAALSVERVKSCQSQTAADVMGDAAGYVVGDDQLGSRKSPCTLVPGPSP